MKNLTMRHLLYLLFPLLLSSCTYFSSDKEDSSNSNRNNNIEIIESIEVSIVCNKESINEYLEKGWKIKSSSVMEVPCTWKTQKSNPKCNLKRDKGCSITVPDIMGTKTTYVLTKTSADSKDN